MRPARTGDADPIVPPPSNFRPGRPAFEDDPRPAGSRPRGRRLSHGETLRWIAAHRAWRPACKVKPIWARSVEPAEVGQGFATADHLDEVARAGDWLCVGIDGEPWFQAPEQIEGSYEPVGRVAARFDFDGIPRTYRVFRPKGSARRWAARIAPPGVEGFFIRAGHDPDRPLYSPVGGYVVRPDAPDPYEAGADDVWLVQRSIFEETYELIADADRSAGD